MLSNQRLSSLPVLGFRSLSGSGDPGRRAAVASSARMQDRKRGTRGDERKEEGGEGEEGEAGRLLHEEARVGEEQQ